MSSDYDDDPRMSPAANQKMKSPEAYNELGVARTEVYYVYRVGYGITAYGTQPTREHYSRTSAQTEAVRLAKHYPGVKFLVLRAIIEVVVPSGVQITAL